METSLVKYKDLALKVIYHTKKRQLGNKIFFATSTFQEVLTYFDQNLKDSQTFLKPCYFINGKQIFPTDILLYYCTVDPNLRLVEEDMYIEIEELEHLDDASEPIYEILLTPLINPFKLIILNIKDGIMQKVDFQKDKMIELGLDNLSNNYACCNSNDSLYLSCGKNFWIISNNNFQIEKKEMPFYKENHSMAYILSNNTIFIAGGSEESFYYDINSKEFITWGKMNGMQEKPALIQFGDFLYSFNSYNQNGIYFEKTKLTNPAKKWEKVVPQSGEQESGFFYNQLYGVSKCYGGNILFAGGINNQLRTFIYNLKLNVLYVNHGKDESVILNERNFYKIDHNFNIAIPKNIENDHIIALVNKNSKSLNLIQFEQIGIKSRNNLLKMDNPRNRLPGNVVIQCRYMSLKDYEHFLNQKEMQNNNKTKGGFDIYNRKEQAKKLGDKLASDPYRYQYRGKTPFALERISEGKSDEESDDEDIGKNKSSSAKKEKRSLDLGLKIDNIGKYNYATEKREEDINKNENKNKNNNNSNINNKNIVQTENEENKENININIDKNENININVIKTNDNNSNSDTKLKTNDNDSNIDTKLKTKDTNLNNISNSDNKLKNNNDLNNISIPNNDNNNKSNNSSNYKEKKKEKNIEENQENKGVDLEIKDKNKQEKTNIEENNQSTTIPINSNSDIKENKKEQNKKEQNKKEQSKKITNERRNDNKIYISDTDKDKKKYERIKHKKFNLNLDKKEEGKNNDSNTNSDLSSTPHSNLTDNNQIPKSVKLENTNNININETNKNKTKNKTKNHKSQKILKKINPTGQKLFNNSENNSNINLNINFNNYNRININDNENIINNQNNLGRDKILKMNTYHNNSKGKINQKKQISNRNKSSSSANNINNININKNNSKNKINNNELIKIPKSNNYIPNNNINNNILKSNTVFASSNTAYNNYKNINSANNTRIYYSNLFIDNSKYHNIGEKETYDLKEEIEPNANKILTTKNTKTIKEIKKSFKKTNYKTNTVSPLPINTQGLLSEANLKINRSNFVNINDKNMSIDNINMNSYKASTYKLNKGKKIITLNHSANYKINIHNNDINILNNSSIPINKRVFKNNISPEQNSRIFSHKMKNNLTEGNIKGELVIKSNKSQNFDTQRINNNNNAYNNNYRMIKYGIDMNNQQNMTNDNIRNRNIIITKDGKRFVLSKNVQRIRREDDDKFGKIEERRKNYNSYIIEGSQ